MQIRELGRDTTLNLKKGRNKDQYRKNEVGAFGNTRKTTETFKGRTQKRKETNL